MYFWMSLDPLVKVLKISIQFCAAFCYKNRPDESCWQEVLAKLVYPICRARHEARHREKKGKTPKSGESSFDNHMKLAYNILKNLEDDIVVDKEIPELDQCSECNNEILTRPPKAITNSYLVILLGFVQSYIYTFYIIQWRYIIKTTGFLFIQQSERETLAFLS